MIRTGDRTRKEEYQDTNKQLTFLHNPFGLPVQCSIYSFAVVYFFHMDSFDESKVNIVSLRRTLKNKVGFDFQA